MKIRYIKGVKVCTVENKLNDRVIAYNYKDVVMALTKIFRESEVHEYSGSDSDPMMVVLLMLAGSCNVRVEEYKIEDVVYDDDKIIKKTKEPKLKLPRFTNAAGEYRGLKKIIGGRASV